MLNIRSIKVAKVSMATTPGQENLKNQKLKHIHLNVEKIDFEMEVRIDNFLHKKVKKNRTTKGGFKPLYS